MKLFSFIERMVSAWKDESFDIKSGLTSFIEYQELKNKKSLDYIDNIMKMNGPGAFLWKSDFERLKLNLEILKEELHMQLVIDFYCYFLKKGGHKNDTQTKRSYL